MRGKLGILRGAALVALAATGVGLVSASSAIPAPGDSADLAITKSDSPDPVTVGSTLTYTLTVRNNGPDGATGVVVSDTLPNSVDFVSASASSGNCNRQGRTVTCNVGAVGDSPPSNTATVTIRVTPRRAGNLSNTAAVSGVETDAQMANNSATEATTVRAAPAGPPASATCRGVAATVKGTGGDDELTGTAGPDVIAAFAGNDTIAAFSGQDLICAGSGNDFVGAGSAADRVFGGTGGDRLLGRGGPDLLKGNRGNDVLKGNRGSDRLRGGRGSDMCRGGAGADSFRSCER